MEFRRRFPPEQRVRGATVWIYSTAPVREVIGTAVVLSVERMRTAALWRAYADQGAVSRCVFEDYFAGVSEGHAIRLGGVRRLRMPVDAARLEGSAAEKSTVALGQDEWQGRCRTQQARVDDDF